MKHWQMFFIVGSVFLAQGMACETITGWILTGFAATCFCLAIIFHKLNQ